MTFNKTNIASTYPLNPVRHGMMVRSLFEPVWLME